jgi:hypothetical protein
MPYCTVCGKVSELHQKQVVLPHDPELFKAVDELFRQLQHLKQDKTYESMLEVVKACHSLEEISFKPVLLRRYRAVQVINSRYASLMLEQSKEESVL